jgi:simple sugar transport system ATP-binding protein
MIHNAILRTYTDPPIRKGPRIDGGEAASSTERLAQRARIRVRDLRAAIGTLSGGNQQRFLARREADAARSLLIAVHPTRGLDIVATDELREAIIAHRNDGNGVLLISEDLDELLVVADRILVMYEGRVVHASSTKSADREEVALAMGGVVETEQPS